MTYLFLHPIMHLLLFLSRDSLYYPTWQYTDHFIFRFIYIYIYIYLYIFIYHIYYPFFIYNPLSIYTYIYMHMHMDMYLYVCIFIFRHMLPGSREPPVSSSIRHLLDNFLVERHSHVTFHM